MMDIRLQIILPYVLMGTCTRQSIRNLGDNRVEYEPTAVKVKSFRLTPMTTPC